MDVLSVLGCKGNGVEVVRVVNSGHGFVTNFRGLCCVRILN